jgi:hypothetical protein
LDSGLVFGGGGGRRFWASLALGRDFALVLTVVRLQSIAFDISSPKITNSLYNRVELVLFFGSQQSLLACHC